MQLNPPLRHLEMQGEIRGKMRGKIQGGIQGVTQRLEEPEPTTHIHSTTHTPTNWFRPNRFHRLICLMWLIWLMCLGWGLASLLIALPAYANDPAGELSRIEKSLAREEAKKTKALQRQRKTQQEISQIKARLTKLARDLKQNQLSLTKARKAYEAAQERLKKPNRKSKAASKTPKPSPSP